MAAKAQEVLRQDPCSGAVFAFRGRRGDRLKLLTWDGQGFYLYYKVLEMGPRLTAAQLAMLLGGDRLAPPVVERAARPSRLLRQYVFDRDQDPPAEWQEFERATKRGSPLNPRTSQY